MGEKVDKLNNAIDSPITTFVELSDMARP